MDNSIKVFKEQRQFTRVPLYSPLRFQIKSSHHFAATLSRDISMGGMRVLSDDFLPLGTSLVLEVTMGDTPRIVNAVAEVVWAQRMPHAERYQLGLRFSELDESYHQEINEYVNSRQF